MRFRDRASAGRELAAELAGMLAADVTHPTVVLGLARGGVPVAAEVARHLEAPLDVLVVRKIGVPGHPEFGIGALTEDGILVVDERERRTLGVSDTLLERTVAHEGVVLRQRVARFRAGRAALDLHGCRAIVVDDGIATGGTARAAIRAVRKRGAAEVILAAPVAAFGAVRSLRAEADRVICVHVPVTFVSVGDFYDDFHQTSDDEVLRALGRRSPA